MKRRREPSLPRDRRATAAVEMALMSPMLLILFSGIVDFGRAYRDEIKLSAAVAAATQYALLNGTSVTSANAAALAATLSGIVANSNGDAWAGATVTVNDGATSAVSSGTTTASGTAANANSCWCPTGSGATWSWGTAVTCGVGCAGGSLAGKFVTITGTRAFSALFANYSVIGNLTLQQTAVVQTQ